MINTNSISAASEEFQEDKLKTVLKELAENDDSVYELCDFSSYPENMTRDDRLVYQIILSCHDDSKLKADMMPRLQQEISDPANQDNYMIDDAVSIIDVKANFTTYRASLKRFRCSAEQFFSLIRLRNKKLENVDSESEEGDDQEKT